MLLVDAARDLGIPPRAEDRSGAGVGIHPVKVSGSQREAPVRVFDGLGVVEEEGAPGFTESSLFTAEYQGAEFEPRVHGGEYRLAKPYPTRRFSKSNSPPTRPLVETDLKKLAAVLSA